MKKNSFGEECEPTQADLDRWAEEEKREYGFSGHDEGYSTSTWPPPKILSKHSFADCNIVGCRRCSGE